VAVTGQVNDELLCVVDVVTIIIKVVTANCGFSRYLSLSWSSFVRLLSVWLWSSLEMVSHLGVKSLRNGNARMACFHYFERWMTETYLGIIHLLSIKNISRHLFFINEHKNNCCNFPLCSAFIPPNAVKAPFYYTCDNLVLQGHVPILCYKVTPEKHLTDLN
jgi:hypothetical protein